MSHIYAIIDFADLDDPNYDFKGATIPVTQIINNYLAKYTTAPFVSSGIKEKFAKNAELDQINAKNLYECLCFTIGKDSLLGNWVTFAWDRGCEFLIAQINTGGYLTMHRIDEDYSFVAHKRLSNIVEWLEKKTPLIAFTGSSLDNLYIISSRKLNAGVIEMKKTIDDRVNFAGRN
jgi:hypothetical protein